MAIQKGLASIKNYNDELARRKAAAEAAKVPWLKIEDGESVKVWYLQELDEGAKNYSEKNGLGFFATEHSNPKNFKIKASCSQDDEEACVGCEKHREDWKLGWKPKSTLYINVLVERKDKEGKLVREVAVMSQGNGPKAVIAPMILEYAVENNSIADRWWKITRKGATAQDTTYTPVVYGPPDNPKDVVDVESYELTDLQRCVRVVPYAEQEAFFFGTTPKPSEDEGFDGPSESSGSTSADEVW